MNTDPKQTNRIYQKHETPSYKYSFQLNEEQNIRFNELLCKAGLEHNRSRFIVRRIFGEEFVVIKRDPSKTQFVARLTDEQLREIAQEYMERMGYGNQPYIVFKHRDISREHPHIVSLRVDEQGRKISDSHEYDLSMSVLRESDRKYGMPSSRLGIFRPKIVIQ